MHFSNILQTDGGLRVDGFKSSDVFELIKVGLADGGPDIIKKVNGVFLFKVAGEGGSSASWVVDAKNGEGSVRIAKDGILIYLLFAF